MRTGKSRLIFTLIVLLSVVTGCGAVVTAPVQVQQPVKIYLVDYGKHSSLIFPNGEKSMYEFAWGDFDWFALGEQSIWSGFRALLFSNGSGFGIREYRHITTLEELKKVNGARSILTIDVEGKKLDKLQSELMARYKPKESHLVYYPPDSMLFAFSREHYWFGYNCNHKTCDWLQTLGCEVHGIAMFGGFRMAE